MPVVVIIEKNGNVKSLAMKTNQEDEFFKRAGFKTQTGFKLQTVFNESNYHIRLYGKSVGKAGQENKYEFPPPVDKLIFFGNCLLVNTTIDGEFVNLTKKEWEEVYNRLFGGFEELDESDDDDDDISSIEEDIPEILTKEGYIKDGFIVDDNSDVNSGSESESEPEFTSTLKSVPKKKIIKQLKSPKPLKTPKKGKKVLEDTNIHSPSFFECKDELEEELYFE